MVNQQKLTLHIITSLSVGGAENMLFKLISSDENPSKHVVVSLTGGGFFADKLSDLGCDVHAFDMKNPLMFLISFFRLVALFYRYRPCAAIFWMYHPCFFSIFCRLFCWGKTKFIWNLRYTPDNLTAEKRLTATLIKLLAYVSFFPHVIIYNSYVAAQLHEAMGYKKRKTKVIPNGFDTENFKPSAALRKQFREANGLHDGELLIGHAARFHPMKDHVGLLTTFKLMLKSNKNLKLLMCGRQVDENNRVLQDKITELGLEGKVSLLGEISDLSNFYPAVDLFISPSAWGEGFPNVIGEAMLCGVPCVVTEVGDSGRITQDFAEPVKAGDYEGLAREGLAMLERSTREGDHLREALREYIVAHYALPTVVRQFNEVFYGR